MDINEKLTISLTDFADQLTELQSYDERLNWLKHFFDRLELAQGKEFLSNVVEMIKERW